MRLDKFLANSGVGSRKEVKEYIKKYRIKVNGTIIKIPDIKINEEKDIIEFDNKIIKYKKYVYIMLNKPKNVITATEDKYHKTVLDLVKGYETYKLFPVGRLDIDTEGFILLTNDGNLAHNLLSPKKDKLKKYYVELENIISDEEIKRVENGVYIDNDYLTKKSKIEKLDKKSLYIYISEGKFHQVKKMFLAVNNKVNYLKRVEISGLKLDENLKLGDYRELTEEELRLLI